MHSQVSLQQFLHKDELKRLTKEVRFLIKGTRISTLKVLPPFKLMTVAQIQHENKSKYSYRKPRIRPLITIVYKRAKS